MPSSETRTCLDAQSQEHLASEEAMIDMAHKKLIANSSDFTSELLKLDDDFAELRDTYAFFCDAVVAMLKTSEEMDHHVVEGLSAFSEQLIGKISAIGERLGRLRKNI